MPRLKARKDKNHKRIARELKELGFYVADTSQLGNGFPDILVLGHHRTLGVTLWLPVEIKQGRNTLTTEEELFLSSLPDDAPFLIAYSTEEILAWFNA